MSIARPLSRSRRYLLPCPILCTPRPVHRLQIWRSVTWRGLETAAPPEVVPYRKQLKDAAKQRRIAGDSKQEQERQLKDAKAQKWELTVGIEVHAQLNTERKLFSRARTSIDAEPNTRVAFFDLAYPGAQPEFQKATLIPALRAAIALNCNIQRRSRFDRKHYFYPDQPAGYQITQYYEPFAKDGSITLYDHDGIAADDGKSITIGIKQIQMEQDTAKTIQQPPDITLLDFNRVSHPLIEIITLPQIHHPQTAAACVKKIQATLEAVNAAFTGMEMGGLRADVNVSVRSKEHNKDASNTHSYYRVSGLGQRTEIKNLSSFKAIEDAIIAERDRQIEVLESGGAIEGETRGWSLGSTETTRLRGKEGEVDYRYMPDPDIAPVIIGQDLIDHISRTLPELPDETLQTLVDDFGVSQKDAKTLVASEGHGQLLYFDDTLSTLVRLLRFAQSEATEQDKGLESRSAKLVANWVIHELTGLFTTNIGPWKWDQVETIVAPWELANILENLINERITGQTAKKLLIAKVDGDQRDIEVMIKEDNLTLRKLSREDYVAMARALIDANKSMAHQVRKGQKGKLMWFVGQMAKQGKGSIEATKAKFVLEELLSSDRED